MALSRRAGRAIVSLRLGWRARMWHTIFMDRDTKKLRPDWDELELAFETSDGEIEHYLDCETGRVIMLMDDMWRIEEVSEEHSDVDAAAAVLAEEWGWEPAAAAAAIRAYSGDERYLPVPSADSRDGYRDMQSFIDTVEDSHFQELLSVAITGRGAFRRFKDVLARNPEERERWFEFKNQRTRARIREWLAFEGVEVEE